MKQARAAATPPSVLRTAAFLFLALLPSGAGAQSPPRPLRLDVDAASGSLTFHLGDLLADRRLGDAVVSGLPLRLTVRVELWRDRFIDGLVDREEWGAVLLYEPLEGRFHLRTVSSATAERTLRSLDHARDALQVPVRVEIAPHRPGRYYYLATLEVETLSLSDIEELRRWLRGELGPAVSGEREPESAVASGLQRLLIRMLGLPHRRFEVRTPTFEMRAAQLPPSGP